MGTEEKRRTLIFPPPLAPRPRATSAGAYSEIAAGVDAAWDNIEEISSAALVPAESTPVPGAVGRTESGERARVDAPEPRTASGERPRTPADLAAAGWGPEWSGARSDDAKLQIRRPSGGHRTLRGFAAAPIALGVEPEPSTADDTARVSVQPGADEEDERPSGRITIPAGAPVQVRAADTITTRPPPAEERDASPHSLRELALALETPTEPIVDDASDPSTEPIITHPVEDHAFTPSSLPPISLDVRPPLTSLPGEMVRSYPVPRHPYFRTAALFASSNLAVGLLVLGTMYALRPQPKPVPREARVSIDDRVTQDSTAGASAVETAPLEGCNVRDLARLIATRAELGPGLDASALESGFGIGLAASTTEAVGVRLDPDTLRTTETIRLKTPWPFAHVTVDRGADPDARIDVRVDGIFARKGGVFAPDGRLLWGLPGAAPKGNEPVRTAGNVVAVRRPGHYWIGVEGSGPMTALLRAHKQLSMPALVARADGGVVAWSERGLGQPNVYAATIAADGKRTTVSQPALLAEGTAPAIAMLPSGELLLTYADNAHRVVAQRLGPDLDPRGEPIIVSGESVNAGQSAVAVDAQGRAIVAYVTAGRGKPEVHATELLCR